MNVLYTNYFADKDERGKDKYNYTRECIFENDLDHRFEDEDYLVNSNQLTFSGCETFSCPICGHTFAHLNTAKACCRKQKWETIEDIPEETVIEHLIAFDEIEWQVFKKDFKRFLEKSSNGFLLCGTVGTWRGSMVGGYYINNFEDLSKFWGDCDYFKIFDEKGHLYIQASHHDGTNYGEIKELTNKGANYKDNHYWDEDQKTHSVLWSSNFYTKLPHYAHKIWGCKKGI